MSIQATDKKPEMQPDLTEVDDIFANLLQEANDYAKAKAMKKANPKQKLSQKLENILQMETTAGEDKKKAENRRIQQSWKETELVLLIHECKCKTCSRVYKSPNNYLLISLYNDVLGKHLKPVNTIYNWQEIYAHLPKKTQVYVSESDVCEECFGGVRDPLDSGHSLTFVHKEHREEININVSP